MLNYEIQNENLRVKNVEDELKNNTKPTTAQLEMYADYILNGKDKNNLSEVQKKNILQTGKRTSFKKKPLESIEGLMELDGFEELNFSPLKPSIYTNPKPVLRENIPELKTLKAAINKIEEKKDNSYFTKHLLIDLKKQQYLIQNEIINPINSKTKGDIQEQELSITFLPLGLNYGNMPHFDNPAEKNDFIPPKPGKYNFDFRNRIHIYQLIENLDNFSTNDLDHQAIANTLKYYINRTFLTKTEKIILEGKLKKETIDEIQQKLPKRLSKNYISTAYTQLICKKIADSAALHYDYWLNRGQYNKFKICRTCGELKLIDSREFTRNKNFIDGYNSECKTCRKIKEEKRRNDKKTSQD